MKPITITPNDFFLIKNDLDLDNDNILTLKIDECDLKDLYYDLLEQFFYTDTVLILNKIGFTDAYIRDLFYYNHGKRLCDTNTCSNGHSYEFDIPFIVSEDYFLPDVIAENQILIPFKMQTG